MKKGVFLFSLFLASVLNAQVLPYNKFSGINTDDSPLTLQNGQTPDSANVLTDFNGLQGRFGFVSFSTEPSSGLWSFGKSDGTKYIITASNGMLKAATQASFTLRVSTISTSVTTYGAQLGDKFFFINTVDGLKSWDGSTLTTIDASFLADKIVSWKGRLVIGNKTGNARVLYLSKYLDGTNFTLVTNPSDDDPTQITVSGALDEGIEGLYVFQDKLMVFKPTSFSGLFGSRRSNFTLRSFSDFVGLSGQESIQDCDGRLRWLARGRRVYEFDGSTFHKISEDVDNLFSTIAQGDAASRSITQTTGADWNGGTTSVDLSTSLVTGSIISKTTTYIYTSQAEFQAGSTDNNVFADTITVTGGVQDTFPDEFASYRDGTSSSKPVWKTDPLNTTASVSGGQLTISLNDGGLGFLAGFVTTRESMPPYQQGTTYYMKATTVSGTGTDAYIYVTTNTFVNDTNIFASGIFSVLVKASSGRVTGTIQGKAGGSVCISSASSKEFDLPAELLMYLSTTTFSVSIGTTPIVSGTHTCSNKDKSTYVSLMQNGPSTVVIDRFGLTPATFTYTSLGMDTGIIQPVWSTFTVTSAGDGVLTHTSQTSSDNSSYDSGVAATSGNPLTSVAKRYVKVNTKFGPTISSGTALSVSDYTIKAGASGTFNSSLLSIGTNITGWGSVVIGDVQGSSGTITYQFGSTNTASLAAITNWQTVTNNSIPTIATGAYAAFRSTFIATNGLAPQLDSFQINWNEGSQIKGASLYPNQRYWLSTSISSTSNNTVLVYDKVGQWQKYTGINAAAMVMHNGLPYFGNSSGIFLAESGYSDNGASISSYYKTSTLAPSGTDIISNYRQVYMTTDNSDSVLSTTYQMEGIATDYSLGSSTMNVTTGIQNFKLPFSFSESQLARYLSLKFSVSGTNFWRIINSNIYFTPGIEPE